MPHAVCENASASTASDFKSELRKTAESQNEPETELECAGGGQE